MEQARSLFLMAFLFCAATLCEAGAATDGQAFGVILSLYNACWEQNDLDAIGVHFSDDIKFTADTATVGKLQLTSKHQVLTQFYGPWMQQAQAKDTTVESFQVQALEGNRFHVTYTIRQAQLSDGSFKPHRIVAEETFELRRDEQRWVISSNNYHCISRTCGI